MSDPTVDESMITTDTPAHDAVPLSHTDPRIGSSHTLEHEPTTPTGKRLLKSGFIPDQEDILAIEREAAEQERERILNEFRNTEDASHAMWTLAGVEYMVNPDA